MDENNQSPTTVDTDAIKMPSVAETPTNATGLLLGIIIVVLVLVLGGLYLWGAQLSKNAAVTPVPEVRVNNEPETPRAVVDQEILNTVSPSDELVAIEADLESTNLESLDTELMQIDAELEAAVQ